MALLFGSQTPFRSLASTTKMSTVMQRSLSRAAAAPIAISRTATIARHHSYRNFASTACANADPVPDRALNSPSELARQISARVLPKLPKPDLQKVLVVGSGGLSIGQAGEFDYSGTLVSTQ